MRIGWLMLGIGGLLGAALFARWAFHAPIEATPGEADGAFEEQLPRPDGPAAPTLRYQPLPPLPPAPEPDTGWA